VINLLEGITGSIISINPLVFHIGVILLSLAIITKAADLLTFGISGYAQKIGLSHYIVGFLIVSMGTALPELISSANGAIIGQPGIAFGTIFGSNMFKILLIGVVFMIARQRDVKKEHIGSSPAPLFALTFLPVLLLIDGKLSRIDGIIMLACYAAYSIMLWRKEEKQGMMQKKIKVKSILKDSAIFLGSLIALLLAGRFLVFSSVYVSNELSISPYLIGILIIGAGGSLPELIVQINAARKKQHGIAFGNAFGSLAANSSFALAAAAIISPIYIQLSAVSISNIFLLVSMILSFVFIHMKKIDWQHGAILILLYLLFVAVEIFI
jgi:cation:H+ antiporter